MEERKRDLALRSEKMTAIVGRIPPALLRYGTAAIVGALFLLVVIAGFLPYRRVYTGILTFYEVNSGEVKVKMLFDGANPASMNGRNKAPRLSILSGDSVGCMAVLRSIAPTRDTLQRQCATIELLIDSAQAKQFTNQTCIFSLVDEQGTIAEKILKW